MVQEVEAEDALTLLSQDCLQLPWRDGFESLVSWDQHSRVCRGADLLTELGEFLEIFGELGESQEVLQTIISASAGSSAQSQLTSVFFTQRCSWRVLAITTSGRSIRWTIPFCTGMFPLTMLALTEPLLCFLVPQVVMDSTTGTKGWDHSQSFSLAPTHHCSSCRSWPSHGGRRSAWRSCTAGWAGKLPS